MRNVMGTMLKVTAVALLALALVAFISACGGSSGGGDETATGGSDEVAEHIDDEAVDEHEDEGEAAAADEHEGGDTVHVALNEWSITSAHGEGFEANAGDVVFEIHNEGAAPHDLKIIKTDLAPDALPVVDGLVDMEAAGEVIGGVDPLPNGEIKVETYPLEGGHYVLICSIPGHYQQGMNAELTVQ